jgi:hypothetical protein
MHLISLNNIYCEYFQDDSSRKLRSRYTSYIDELYKTHNKKLDHSTFEEGGKLTYSKMGEKVLQLISNDYNLNEFDLIIISYWVHDCDPDHASYAAYFSYKYKITCPIFDVTDRGTLSSVAALDVLKSYHKTKNIKKSLLLNFEQTTVPRNKNDYDIIPFRNICCALIFENMNFSSYNLIYIDYIYEDIIIKNHQYFYKYMNIFINKNNILKEETTIVLSKNSLLWKIINYNNICKNELILFNIDFYENTPGAFNYLIYLDHILKKDFKSKNIIIFHEDFESLNYGVLFFQY